MVSAEVPVAEAQAEEVPAAEVPVAEAQAEVPMPKRLVLVAVACVAEVVRLAAAGHQSLGTDLELA